MPQKVTPEISGASQLACDIINDTFLSLDGFRKLRRECDQDDTYPAIAFAASLARVVDRNLKNGARNEPS
jgi:flagellar biosynthesis/type III secretory pathway ATPase